jgi:hypothetical protein
MVINLMQAIYMNDEQFQNEMAKRRQKLGLKVGETMIGCPMCGTPPPPARTGNPQ